MILKLTFGLFTATNVALCGLLFALGLAAAPASRAPMPVLWVGLLGLPGLMFAASVMLFVWGGTPMRRGAAVVMAAAPVLMALSAVALGHVDLSRYADPGRPGGHAQFKTGALRELEDAIARNDAPAVAALAGQADLRTASREGSSVLVLALRELARHPGPPTVLQALLHAGADPNAGTHELPLTLAIGGSSKTGIAPVQLLLDAGASPNQRLAQGDPAWFAAVAKTVSPDVLTLLLDREADLQARTGDGGNVLTRAVAAQNWPAVRLLLQRGARWDGVRTPMGLDFRAQVEADIRNFGGGPEQDAVLRFIDGAAPAPSR